MNTAKRSPKSDELVVRQIKKEEIATRTEEMVQIEHENGQEQTCQTCCRERARCEINRADSK